MSARWYTVAGTSSAGAPRQAGSRTRTGPHAQIVTDLGAVDRDTTIDAIVPHRAIALGFRFRYETAGAALEILLAPSIRGAGRRADLPVLGGFCGLASSSGHPMHLEHYLRGKQQRAVRTRPDENLDLARLEHWPQIQTQEA